jgi:prefoldin alpha subunit
MTATEQERAQLNYELAVYKEQIALIKRETERISLTTVDLTNALNTVENLKEADAQKALLVPIGGGTMLKGSMTDTKILVPIGSEYVVEMGRDEAMREIEKRIEATKKAVEKLTEEFDKVAGKLREASVTLNKIQSQSELSERVDENIREDYI